MESAAVEFHRNFIDKIPISFLSCLFDTNKSVYCRLLLTFFSFLFFMFKSKCQWQFSSATQCIILGLQRQAYSGSEDCVQSSINVFSLWKISWITNINLLQTKIIPLKNVYSAKCLPLLCWTVVSELQSDRWLCVEIIVRLDGLNKQLCFVVILVNQASVW